MYSTNNLAGSASLNMATNPTAGDTVTIQGVVFTYRAAPALAGEVDIGVDAAASLANLVALINTPQTTTA